MLPARPPSGAAASSQGSDPFRRLDPRPAAADARAASLWSCPAPTCLPPLPTAPACAIGGGGAAGHRVPTEPWGALLSSGGEWPVAPGPASQLAEGGPGGGVRLLGENGRGSLCLTAGSQRGPLVGLAPQPGLRPPWPPWEPAPQEAARLGPGARRAGSCRVNGAGRPAGPPTAPPHPGFPAPASPARPVPTPLGLPVSATSLPLADAVFPLVSHTASRRVFLQCNEIMSLPLIKSCQVFSTAENAFHTPQH